jgi:uncharacterized phage protein gp47/JayE
MADVYTYLDATGVIVPDTADLRTAVEDEYRLAFGSDLVVTANTPQGVLITAETEARDAVVRLNASVANQINPSLSGGVFLDALWALMGGERVKATPSLLTAVELTGQPGAIIPEGAQARVGTAGAIFASTGAVQLDSLGEGVVDFQALENGPTTVAAGALNRIVTAVLGWETVSNPTAAEPGTAEESDAAARLRRRQTLGLQSVGQGPSILAGLYAINGVRSVCYRENYMSAPVVIEGVTIAGRSIYVAIKGGTDTQVATALLDRKSAGCGWVGTTTVAVTEPISGQTYDVSFQRPDDIRVYVKFTVRAGSVTGDPESLVKSAAVAYANGDIEGEEGFVIGADVSPFELSGAVQAQVPGLFIQLVEIGTDPGSLSTANITVNIDEIATLQPGDVTVVVVP